MSEMTKSTWNKDFIKNYQALIIILLKKAQLKSEIALNSINKKKNSFKIQHFEEFLKYPNEYLEIKQDLEKLRELIV